MKVVDRPTGEELEAEQTRRAREQQAARGRGRGAEWLAAVPSKYRGRLLEAPVFLKRLDTSISYPKTREIVHSVIADHIARRRRPYVQPSKEPGLRNRKRRGYAMTTLISHTVGSLQTSFLSAFANHIAELCAGARDGFEIEARYDALARKSDSDLAAIGLARQMLRERPWRAAATDPHRFLLRSSRTHFAARPRPGGLFCGPCELRYRRLTTTPRAAMEKPASPLVNLFSVFPENLSARLFASARPVRLAADEVLFLAGDPGDGCYRVEQGLLKVSIISPAGAERILAIVGPGAHPRRASTIDGLPRSASVTAVREFRTELRQPRRVPGVRRPAPGRLQASRDAARGRLRDTDAVVAAGSFLPLKGRVARALLDLPRRSARTSARAVFSSARRSARATSPPWPASRARTSAAS